jgi:fermentation-respiration switch protein FrsA (DUF1100 family)
VKLPQSIENRLIFFPCRYPAGDWNPPGLVIENVNFQAEDCVRLHGWYCPCPQERPNPFIPEPRLVLLYCHGNAGNVTTRADNIRAWQTWLGVDVFIFDYRGYGQSDGRPDEPGIYRDGRAAYRWLTAERKTDPMRIVLFGRSLGGAVALELGLAVDHRCLVLESTFLSVGELAAEIYPWLPVRMFLRSRFDNWERIARYRQPVLISHGLADELIPHHHAQELFELANEPKRLLEVPGAGHEDLSQRGGQWYFQVMKEFLESARPIGRGTAQSE